MDKFKNKYRISTARLQNWDYSWAAVYFITIGTHDRLSYFGEIIKGKMQLSSIGEMVESEWLKTFELRKDMNLYMGEFVVMPNHFHAIIGICENSYNTQRNTHRRDAMHCVSTFPNHTLDSDTLKSKNKFMPQSKNLASIIRGFKSSVTVNACKINIDFRWQSRFHDHIIRNNDSFNRITNYIIHNPANWQEDNFFN